MRFYHGATVTTLASILTNGILGTDYHSKGSTFVSPRPDVAFAYACMGVEGQYLAKAGNNLPDNERVLLILDIPQQWHDDHFVRSVGGSCPETSYDADIPVSFISDHIIGDRKSVYKLI
jgi:hypothetical protein